MRKSILLFFALFSLIVNFGLTEKLQAQTATVTVNYPGFLACGGCAVCGGDYYCFNTLSSYCGNTAACITKTFTNPVPAGNIVTGVNIGYFSAGCAGGSLSANINGQSVPTVNEGSAGCLCSNAPCVQSASSSSVFPCGLPAYNNAAGGSNSIQLCTGFDVCINRLVITLTYAPANQASPATQPSSVNGQANVCVGAAQTYSCPAVANASSYNWTFPPGWIVNSGAGTNVITATPGSAGNVCVRAQNLCGNSAYTCMAVNLLTASTPPASASANPNSVCASSTTSTLSLSGGSLGSAASWNWYSGSCGGTFVGTGTSITVSPSSTTTYYVQASGTCNTTSCASVALTVNPAPTANAGAPKVLNCTTTNTVLSGSGGGSYSWSGPGIVSGGATATPTVNLPGTYSLIVTNAGCPSLVSTVSVTQDNTPPSVSNGVSGVLNCTLTSVNVNASTAASPVSYNWSGTGITGGNGTGTITVNQPGTFNYTVTNTNNGCSTTGSQVVTQNSGGPAVTAATSGSLNCTVTSVSVSATTAASPVSYNWSGTGITAGAGTGTISVNQAGTFNYTVTNTSNGCSSTGSQVVSQNNTPPSVTPSASGILSCTVTSVNASATTAASPVSYNWSGTGITGGSGTGTITVNQPGTFNYTVTNTSNNCTTTGSQVISQNTVTPGVTMPATQTITCAASSVTLAASANPSTCTPVWTGGVSSGVNSFTATASSANVYTLTVTNPSNGCTASGTTQVLPSAGFPTVNGSASNPITCVTTTAQVIATTTSTPVSYSWSGPGIVSGAATATANVNAGGQYTVVVQNTSSLCSSTITIGVTTNTTPTTPTISPTGSITCSTPSVTINGSPGSGLTYTWTGSGIIGSANSQNVDVNQSGVYTLSVTNSDGCIGAATTTVIANNSTPTFTLGTAGSVTTTCAAPSATLSASSSDDPNTLYTWTTPSSSTVTGNSIVTSGAGIYTVVVTNTLTGCSTSSSSAQATVEVVVDAGVPTVTLSTTSLSITCLNPTPTLTLTTTSSPVSYSWTPTAGIASGTETTANPVFNTAGSYSVVVTNTNTGCATSIASNVVTVTLDNSPPVVSFTTAANSGTLTCANPSFPVSPTLPAGSYTYTWSPAAGISTPINQANATFTATGVYTLAVTNTVTGCVSSSTNAANTFSITQDINPPSASIAAISSNSTIGCGATNTVVTLEATPNPTNSVISWLPGGATSSTLNINASGTYSLIVIDPINGCRDTIPYTVSGNTNPPQYVDAGTTVFIPCNSTTVALVGVTSTTNCSYSWTGPTPTSILSGSTTTNPIVGEAGIYTLTVTRNDNGCQATATVSVVKSVVTAAFSADPTTGTSPLTVNFTDGSTGATVWTWNFGDSSPLVTYSPVSQNPNNVYPIGSYTVTLIASSGLCSDTASTVIIVEDGLSLEIPNVFTPNNDNSNDVFTIHSTGIKEITLQIFNRWGEKLYEFTGPKASWDGLTPGGTLVPEGTYFYFVKATGFDETEIERQGTLNLFR